MSRTTKKANPGRILFVGSGPGDPDLLTVRARSVITSATTAYVDPDVPATVVAMIGADHREQPADDQRRSTSKAKKDQAAKDQAKADATTTDDATSSTGADATTGDAKAPDAKAADTKSAEKSAEEPEDQIVRPALGDPSEVAKTLVAAAKAGDDVVRVVSGDPLTTDSVLAEVNAVARTSVTFEVLPGLPAASVVPSYAGMPLGSRHTEADVRAEGVDWAALAAAPGPLVLHATSGHLAETASALTEHGLAPQTPVAITINGTTCAQRTIEATLATLNEQGNALTGPLILTIGQVVTQRGKLSWWESRALYGWTVLVPRTKDQAADMSDRLVSHGAIPKEVPTIAVEPPRSPAQMERAVKGLVDGRYQWVVFTSTNSVRAVWEKFAEFGLDARAFSGVKIACVGEATAAKVRAFGINPELVPSGEQSSLGLLEDFPPYDDVFDPVDRILLPRADIATETLSEGLRERGWEIDDVTAYRTVRAAPPPAQTREMIKTGGFDAVCFTSSSTVRNLVGIAGKPHARTIVACIGPKTAETATEFGLRVDVQPENASVTELVDALAEHAARLRAEGALPPPRKKTRRSRS
ncbi:bifunctional uroporphyrinogen-III C-methyltransferase/uroporphyrinogen-III synthase [Gordonia sp. NB41Y]|uniref:uroporphyrinogen-III synthase n=1 Tax=Gordonia sp. NB41Y TaxID=875808 RepID=UPI0006B1EE6E|nr:bifunctional uroporphyrinogen-III C-methyltransferase/uroporphyrinogen-III synthase [Gordonia sp. NB41Y]KOY49706.1 uroporphyrin-III methyltransferase [Gordonia sp. NB41Y]WLP92228.1 bifunctional uroporphyrinogen-III C-methyltransferase/uroporphyrinogen-III synthase [Gordonia sp. NB41Y]